MKCKKCGNIFSEGRYCPECGTPIEETNIYMPDSNYKNNNIQIKKKWYQRTGVILLLLIFVFPVGLFLMWKYMKNWKFIVKAIITIIVLFLAWCIFSPEDDNNSAYKVRKNNDSKATAEVEKSENSIYEGMPEKSIGLSPGEDRDDIPELIKVSFEEINDYKLKRDAQRKNNKLVKKQNLLSVKYIDAQLIPLVDYGISKIEDDVIQSEAELEEVNAVASFATDKGTKELKDEKIYVWLRYKVKIYDDKNDNTEEEYRYIKVSSTVSQALDYDSYVYFSNDDFSGITDIDLFKVVTDMAAANSHFYTHYTESGENGNGPSIYYSTETQKVNYAKICKVDEISIKDEIKSKRGDFKVDYLKQAKAMEEERNQKFEDFVSISDYVREDGALSTISIKEKANNQITFSIYIGADGADSIYCMDSIVANYDSEKNEAIYEDGDYKLILTHTDDDEISVQEINRQDGNLTLDGNYSDITEHGYPIDAGVIYKDSNYSLIDDNELECYSSQKQIYSLARNEIYARHGRKFNDVKLQKYFESCPWYNEEIEPDDFNESELSYIEKENLKSISNFENR